LAKGGQKPRQKAITVPVSKCHYNNGRVLAGWLQQAARQRRTTLPGLSPPGTWASGRISPVKAYDARRHDVLSTADVPLSPFGIFHRR